MSKFVPAILLAAALITAPAVASAQPSQAELDKPRSDPATGARFKCQDGGELTALFASRDARLVAIVDSGDGPHALPLTPWTGGPPKITWTDGQRTLTWSPGVQLMFMDGQAHRMCGRGGHSH